MGLNAALIAGGAGAGALGGASSNAHATQLRNEKIINDARMADARNKVLQNYTGVQSGLQGENTQTANDTIAHFGAPQGQVLTDAQGNRIQTVTDNLAPLNDPSYTDVPLAGDAPAGVKSDIAARLRAGFDHALKTSKANAKLGGYGDQWAGNALATAGAGRKVDTVNSFARGNTTLLPSLQDFAQYGANQPVVDNGNVTGSVLSTVGKLLAGAGGSGYFKSTPATPSVLSGPKMEGGIWPT